MNGYFDLLALLLGRRSVATPPRPICQAAVVAAQVFVAGAAAAQAGANAE